MCDRRRGHALFWACRAVGIGAVLMVSGTRAARSLGAQTVAEWRARYDSARVMSARADSEWVRVVETIKAARTARIVAGGRTVRYEPGDLSARDSVRLATGLTQARERLLERFGPRGAALLDTATWFIGSVENAFARPGQIQLFTSEDASRSIVDLPRPVDPRRVEAFFLQVAGIGLPWLAPSLQRYAGGAATLADEPDRFVAVARTMALSWGASGRRCLTGALIACRAALTDAEQEDRLAMYFEPGDWRSVVVASESPADADSLFFVDRRACLDGAFDSCERIVGRVRVPDPYGSTFRATLVMHALDLGGAGVLDRLVELRAEEDPLRLLAQVAAVSEDSLISSWQRRVVRTLDEERSSQLPLAFAVIGWGALAVVGASLRKP